MVTLGAPEVAEILSGVGYDWLFVDAEHGPFEALGVQRVLQGAGADMPCLVRLPDSSEVPIKKALDVGAAGIIAPMVNSAEQAERVVRLSKYAPLGTRGVGLGRAHGYGLNFQEYVDRANDELATVVQAEHIQAVENIEAIVRVPGVDAVLIGPYDLSASLGRPGQVEHSEVTSAIARVTRACKEVGVPLGVFGVSAEAVRPYIEEGYTLIVAGVDTLMLGQAAQEMLAAVRR
jgi:2-keto-3-deoxy-L-rhamnonate aldolase RhmA